MPVESARIAVEGVDGTGKTTLSQALTAALRREGYVAEYFSFEAEFFKPPIRPLFLDPHARFLMQAGAFSQAVRASRRRTGIMVWDRYAIFPSRLP